MTAKKNKHQQFWQFFFKRYFFLPIKILKISVIDTIDQDGIEHAGYLAFLSILSLFPFLIFLVSIAALFGENPDDVKMLVALLNNLPGDIVDALLPRIEEIITSPPQSLLTVAIIGIIWTASAAVEGLRTILNRAYRVKSPPTYIWRRLLSIGQFFLITLTITATMIFLVAVPAILKKVETMLSINFSINYDWFYLRQFIIFLILLATTSLLYYVIPNVNQKIDNTLPGSIVCVVLWSVILKLFAIYLQNFNQFNLLYGSLGGVIGALMFFYLVGLVFIIGAEFNYHFRKVYNIHLNNYS